MNIFQDKTPMPPAKDVVSVHMVREEDPRAPRMSGERHYPDLAVRSVERPRRGHGY
jgi:hypothetical protein